VTADPLVKFGRCCQIGRLVWSFETDIVVGAHKEVGMIPRYSVAKTPETPKGPKRRHIKDKLCHRVHSCYQRF
jgi:hypothetical protein